MAMVVDDRYPYRFPLRPVTMGGLWLRTGHAPCRDRGGSGARVADPGQSCELCRSTSTGMEQVTSTLYSGAEFATTLRARAYVLTSLRDDAPCVRLGERVALTTATPPSPGPDTRRPPQRTGRPPGPGRARPWDARRCWVRQRLVNLHKDGSDDDARAGTAASAVCQALWRPPLWLGDCGDFSGCAGDRQRHQPVRRDHGRPAARSPWRLRLGDRHHWGAHGSVLCGGRALCAGQRVVGRALWGAVPHAGRWRTVRGQYGPVGAGPPALALPPHLQPAAVADSVHLHGATHGRGQRLVPAPVGPRQPLGSSGRRVGWAPPGWRPW